MTGVGVFGESKENAQRIDAITGGFERARLIAVEGGFGQGGDEIEGLGIDAVAEGEAMSARQSDLRDQP